MREIGGYFLLDAFGSSAMSKVLIIGRLCGIIIISGTGCTLVWQEWIIVSGWFILGAAFYIWSKLKYKDKFAELKITYQEENG